MPVKQCKPHSYLSHTERWDQEENNDNNSRFPIHSSYCFFFLFFLFLVSPVLQPSSQNLPKSFSQATSTGPTQHPHSILLVHPQVPLFWIILHGSHSVCMASRQNDKSEQNTVGAVAECKLVFHRRTRWSQPENDWLDKLLFFVVVSDDYKIICRPCMYEFTRMPVMPQWLFLTSSCIQQQGQPNYRQMNWDWRPPSKVTLKTSSKPLRLLTRK